MDDWDNNRVKMPTTLDEQVAILRSRGVIVDDVESAKEILNQIGYYRLVAYGLPFSKKKTFTYLEQCFPTSYVYMNST